MMAQRLEYYAFATILHSFERFIYKHFCEIMIGMHYPSLMDIISPFSVWYLEGHSHFYNLVFGSLRLVFTSAPYTQMNRSTFGSLHLRLPNFCYASLLNFSVLHFCFTRRVGHGINFESVHYQNKVSCVSMIWYASLKYALLHQGGGGGGWGTSLQTKDA